MSERVLLLLAQPTVLEALQADDIVETLSDISPLSDFYIPTLQFLMRPDNLVALVFSLLEEPPMAIPSPQGKEPTYEEYAIVYRAHWILCSSGFSSQLISAMLALQQPACAEHHRPLCERLSTYYSRDTMNLEALTRFLNVFMDQYSPESLISFLGTTYDLQFVQSLLVLIHYEPIRDVLLRICNEIPASMTTLHPLITQLLCQLSPDRCCCGYLDDEAITRSVKKDPDHVRFARMIFTCDLITDLIHERRQGSLGYWFVHALTTNESHISQLLDAATRDLEALPSQMANESYVLKVLNSLLQQAQCGCVSKVAFAAAFSRTQDSDEPPVDDALLSPHVDLPPLWKWFIVRLPELLARLAIPPHRRYRPCHLQLVYLMLPILNVSCRLVDAQLIAHKTMEHLLALITRFPQANILHCAISRLYIVALEDSPFMFGKELPAFRAANDPLRLHMLLHGCFDAVVSVYDEPAAAGEGAPPPPPAFVDIAISFDQAVTNAHAHSPHLFRKAMMDRWHGFRDRVLLPTQTKWEEQHQGDAQGQLALSPTKHPGEITDGEELLPTAKVEGEVSPPVVAEAVVAEEVPTPLSALYNDEEKHLMRHVAAADPVASTCSPSS